MIKLILQMLPFVETGLGTNIDIAKGKYQYPTNLKEIKKVWQSRK
jgi:hypothetical protein